MLRERLRRSLAAGFCGLACLVLAGCGGGPKLPPVAPVTGIVTFEDGTPLPRGTVQFVPEASSLPKGAKGTPAVGNIGPDGHYTLKTAGVEGAIVGLHKINVRAQAEPKNGMDTWPPSLILEKYNNEQTSGLTFEVKADQKNTCDLKLKPKR